MLKACRPGTALKADPEWSRFARLKMEQALNYNFLKNIQLALSTNFLTSTPEGTTTF